MCGGRKSLLFEFLAIQCHQVGEWTIPSLKTLVAQFISFPVGYALVSKNSSMLIMALKVMVIKNIMCYAVTFSILGT